MKSYKSTQTYCHWWTVFYKTTLEKLEKVETTGGVKEVVKGIMVNREGKIELGVPIPK